MFGPARKIEVDDNQNFNNETSGPVRLSQVSSLKTVITKEYEMVPKRPTSKPVRLTKDINITFKTRPVQKSITQDIRTVATKPERAPRALRSPYLAYAETTKGGLQLDESKVAQSKHSLVSFIPNLFTLSIPKLRVFAAVSFIGTGLIVLSIYLGASSPGVLASEKLETSLEDGTALVETKSNPATESNRVESNDINNAITDSQQSDTTRVPPANIWWLE